METVLASRNSTERKGEPEIDFVGPVYSNRTGIIARGRDTVLPVNDTSPELRPADAGKPGMVRKLVETGLGAGASLLLGRAGMKMTASLASREKATDALVRMSAAALLVGKAAAAPPPPAPPSSCDTALDLSTQTSPLSSSTVGVLNTYGTSCGGAGNEKIFYVEVPAGGELTIGMTSNTYNSRHETRWGGSCPGDNSVACTDAAVCAPPATGTCTWPKHRFRSGPPQILISKFRGAAANFEVDFDCQNASVMPQDRA